MLPFLLFAFCFCSCSFRPPAPLPPPKVHKGDCPFCVLLGVTSKILTLDNKRKMIYSLYCPHLIVALASPKILMLDNTKKISIFFVLFSLNRTFVPKIDF